MGGMGDATLQALRSGEAPPDPRLDALREFTRTVVRDRGWVKAGAVEDFIEAGFTRRNVLDVMTGIPMKTLSN